MAIYSNDLGGLTTNAIAQQRADTEAVAQNLQYLLGLAQNRQKYYQTDSSERTANRGFKSQDLNSNNQKESSMYGANATRESSMYNTDAVKAVGLDSNTIARLRANNDASNNSDVNKNSARSIEAQIEKEKIMADAAQKVATINNPGINAQLLNVLTTGNAAADSVNAAAAAGLASDINKNSYGIKGTWNPKTYFYRDDSARDAEAKNMQDSINKSGFTNQLAVGKNSDGDPYVLPKPIQSQGSTFLRQIIDAKSAMQPQLNGTNRPIPMPSGNGGQPLLSPEANGLANPASVTNVATLLRKTRPMIGPNGGIMMLDGNGNKAGEAFNLQEAQSYEGMNGWKIAEQ